MHAALVSEVRDVACLAEDRFGSLEVILRGFGGGAIVGGYVGGGSVLVVSGYVSDAGGEFQPSAALPAPRPARLAPTTAPVAPDDEHVPNTARVGGSASSARTLRMYVYDLGEIGMQVLTTTPCHFPTGTCTTSERWAWPTATRMMAAASTTSSEICY